MESVKSLQFLIINPNIIEDLLAKCDKCLLNERVESNITSRSLILWTRANGNLFIWEEWRSGTHPRPTKCYTFTLFNVEW